MDTGVYTGCLKRLPPSRLSFSDHEPLLRLLLRLVSLQAVFQTLFSSLKTKTMRFSFKADGVYLVVWLFASLIEDSLPKTKLAIHIKKINSIKMVPIVGTEEVLVILSGHRINPDLIMEHMALYAGGKCMQQTLHVSHKEGKIFKNLPKVIKDNGLFTMHTPDSENASIAIEREKLESQGYLTLVVNVLAKKNKKPEQRIYKLKLQTHALSFPKSPRA